MRAEFDYYEVLGVRRDADNREIKSAFRGLAREYHPDANPDDPEAEDRFKEVAEAYEVLSDPERRRQYDMFGQRASGAGGGPADFGSIFDMFFGDAFSRPGSRRGRSSGGDVVVEAELSFEQGVFGTTLDLPPIEMLVACEDCSGSGAEEGTHPGRCSRCGGTGEVRDVRRTFLGNVVTAYPCQQCSGTGEEITSPCRTCRGEGRIQDARTISVEVPAGIEDGSQLRIEGRGHAARRGGRPGDLYVTLRVRSHPVLERNGINLFYRADISIAQAALGTVLAVPSLDGDKEVIVEPGTQYGTLTKIKGAGVPRINGRGRGDLIVAINVTVPTDLTDSESDLILRFAELRGEKVGSDSRSRRPSKL